MNLPEPEEFGMICGSPSGDMYFYTESQLKEYGAACYARAIEDAAKVCSEVAWIGRVYGVTDCITAIRALLKEEK